MTLPKQVAILWATSWRGPHVKELRIASGQKPARNWGTQVSSMQGTGLFQKWCEFETGYFPSQTSDETTGLVNTQLQLCKTLKQKAQLSCAQMPDPQKMRCNKGVFSTCWVCGNIVVQQYVINTKVNSHRSQHFKGSRTPTLLFFLRFYLFIWQRERESTSRENSRGRGRSRLPAKQGARCGARSQDPEIMTQAKGRRLTTEPPRRPVIEVL